MKPKNPKVVRHAPFEANWSDISRHVQSDEAQSVLVRDFAPYVKNRWGIALLSESWVPRDFENENWSWRHHGKEPAFWAYAHMEAELHLLNLNLVVAQRAFPGRAWHILHDFEGGTVFDGSCTIFDFNAAALGINAREKLLAFRECIERKPGEQIELPEVGHWTVVQGEELALQAEDIAHQLAFKKGAA